MISQFYQLDRLVVEGQKTVWSKFIFEVSKADGWQGKQTGDRGDIVRQKDVG